MSGWTTADWLIFLLACHIAIIGFLKLLANRRATIFKQLQSDIKKQQRKHKKANAHH